MRILLLMTFVSIFFLSCNKNIETDNSKSSYISKVKAGLKDSLSVIDYANLDFERSVVTKKDNQTCFFRVPVIGKKF